MQLVSTYLNLHFNHSNTKNVKAGFDSVVSDIGESTFLKISRFRNPVLRKNTHMKISTEYWRTVLTKKYQNTGRDACLWGNSFTTCCTWTSQSSNPGVRDENLAYNRMTRRPKYVNKTLVSALHKIPCVSIRNTDQLITCWKHVFLLW
jgi:hypothetical protein